MLGSDPLTSASPALRLCRTQRMEGNAKIIRLIARDEALHLTGTQHMLNLLRSAATIRKWRKSPKSASRSAATCSCGGAAGERVGGLPVPRRLDDGLNKDILCQYVEHHQYPHAGGGPRSAVPDPLNPIHGSTPAGLRQRSGGAAEVEVVLISSARSIRSRCHDLVTSGCNEADHPENLDTRLECQDEHPSCWRRWSRIISTSNISAAKATAAPAALAVRPG